MAGRELTKEETEMLDNITYALPAGTRVKLSMETPAGEVYQAEIKANSFKFVLHALQKPASCRIEIEGAEGGVNIPQKYSNLSDLLWGRTKKPN